MANQVTNQQVGATIDGEGDRVFSIEQHGLDPIPVEDRHGSPRELFWTWLGGAYNYVALAAGALPILFGLSLWQALLAVLIGNVLGAVVFGLCAIHGPRTATATIVNTRAALGHKGNLLAAAISFFSVAGWVAVNSVLAAFALIQLLGVAGIVLNDVAKAILVGVVLIVQMAIAIYGHATVVALERVFAIASGILLTGVLIFIVPQIDWMKPAAAEMAGSTTIGTWLLALGVMFAGPLSWAIAALHAQARRPEDTDWKQIDQLYAILESLTASPVVTLNRAVAVSKVEGPEAALAMIEPLASRLNGYFHFFGVRGGLLMQLGRAEEAREAFDRAIALANTAAEAAHIRMHLDRLQKDSAKAG